MGNLLHSSLVTIVSTDNTAVRPSSMAKAVAHQVIIFVAVLLIAIQAIIFIVIDHAVSFNARKKIEEELHVGERIFLRLLDERSMQLTTEAKILTSDFAFRKAILTGDRGTIKSALSNHGSRIGATKMILVGPENEVIADATAASDGLASKQYVFRSMLDEASVSGNAAAIKLIGGVPYQLVVVPIFAPAPVGSIVLGFSIDKKLAVELGSLISLDVSFVAWDKNNDWSMAATNVSLNARERILQMLKTTRTGNILGDIPNLSNQDYVTSASILTRDGDSEVIAILQRSLAEDIARYNAVRMIMLVLAVVSLAGTIIGSFMIARSISRPVTALVEFARRLERGDYEQGPPDVRTDEFAELASAFNHMRLGISAREQQIKAMAYHDSLTGLPNRALFNDRLNQAIGVARRLNHPVSVMLIDLNRFKEVNDTFGHHVGDILLREVALRLRGGLGRASDTSARLGGDEFAVLLPAATTELAKEVARKILHSFEAPCIFEGHILDIGGSIGVATFPQHGDEQHVLMSHADVAMYYAKRKRLGFVVYDKQLDVEPEAQDNSFSLSGELRQAIENNEFALYYQPRINLLDSNVCEVEALVRWKHPKRGLLAPEEFIPFATKTGYIREITFWVMNAACKQFVHWRDQGLEIAVSINISARDLLNEELIEHFGKLLRHHDASARWFILEIPEQGIMDNLERVLNTVHQLSDMGFRLSIDNLSIGYSSLAGIKKLRLAELKIDRFLVANMEIDVGGVAIVRSIIDLAHNMNLSVVAQGVESAAIHELLSKIGCNTAQGNYFCEPVPADQLETWLVHNPRFFS